MPALPALSVTDRYKLKELTLERSTILPAGKVMYCRGRKILGYGTVADLPKVLHIPKGADTLTVSAADHAGVLAWLA